jgi:hypothetical protein
MDRPDPFLPAQSRAPVLADGVSKVGEFVGDEPI